jgi:hypothetical protein
VNGKEKDVTKYGVLESSKALRVYLGKYAYSLVIIFCEIESEHMVVV